MSRDSSEAAPSQLLDTFTDCRLTIGSTCRHTIHSLSTGTVGMSKQVVKHGARPRDGDDTDCELPALFAKTRTRSGGHAYVT